MARDKRRIEVDGVPLLARACAALRPICDEILVSCRRDGRPDAGTLERFHARLVFDRHVDGGPLAGIEAALASLPPDDLAVVVAVDMPWLSTALLRHLVDIAAATDDADAIVPVLDGRDEPLAAVYRARIAPTLAGLVDREERRVGALLDVLAVHRVGPDEWRPFDPDGRTFVNLNEPSDLEPPVG